MLSAKVNSLKNLIGSWLMIGSPKLTFFFLVGVHRERSKSEKMKAKSRCPGFSGQKIYNNWAGNEKVQRYVVVVVRDWIMAMASRTIWYPSP